MTLWQKITDFFLHSERKRFIRAVGVWFESGGKIISALVVVSSILFGTSFCSPKFDAEKSDRRISSFIIAAQEYKESRGVKFDNFKFAKDGLEEVDLKRAEVHVAFKIALREFKDAEMKFKADEVAEAKRRADEAKRLADEKQKQEEARLKAEREAADNKLKADELAEAKRRAEEARRLADEKQKKEEARLKAEREAAAIIKRNADEAEAKRLAELADGIVTPPTPPVSNVRIENAITANNAFANSKTCKNALGLIKAYGFLKETDNEPDYVEKGASKAQEFYNEECAPKPVVKPRIKPALVACPIDLEGISRTIWPRGTILSGEQKAQKLACGKTLVCDGSGMNNPRLCRLK